MKLKQLYPLLMEQIKKPLREQSTSDGIDPFEPIPYDDEHEMDPSEKAMVHATAKKDALKALQTSLYIKKHYWEKRTATYRAGANVFQYGDAPSGGIQWGDYWFRPQDLKDPQMLQYFQRTSGLATKVKVEMKEADRLIAKFKKQAKKDKALRQATAAATNPLLNSASTGAIPLSKAPTKIITGPRSKGISNPALRSGAKNPYCGDPKSAPFTPQMKKLYIDVSTALARNGKVLSAIYMGDNEFVAVTADGKFAWRKWGMMNKIYMNSDDMNTSEFTAKTPTQQDGLLKKNGIV